MNPSPPGMELPMATPREDRVYLGFIAAALLTAIGVGFVLAVLIPLTAAGRLPWASRYPQLVQAHGWSQLLGWAGLFVAGMGLRLIPRFAGARPVEPRVSIAILASLAGGLARRVIAQVVAETAPSGGVMYASGLATGLGMLVFASAIAGVLGGGRRQTEAWLLLVAAGCAWWGVWGVLTVIGAGAAAGNESLVPSSVERASVWIAQLGAIGNFTWAVQSRAVPVFFGRTSPSLRRVAIPVLLLNAGLALVALSIGEWPGTWSHRLTGGGLALTGIAMVWLAPAAGSIRGEASRLRPSARAASRFVLAANWWAVAGGVLLAWGGGRAFVTGEVATLGVLDAARHAVGAGYLTLLIVGMARLVLPLFALERAEASPLGIEFRAGWPVLMLAVTLRVSSALLAGHLDEQARLDLVTASGVLAWLGLATFAWALLRARLKEPRMKALIRKAAAGPGKERRRH